MIHKGNNKTYRDVVIGVCFIFIIYLFVNNTPKVVNPSLKCPKQATKVVEKIIKVPEIVKMEVPVERHVKTTIKCMKYDQTERPKAPPKWMDVLNDAIEIFNEFEYKYSITFGTLLHMYRDCGLLPDTGDVDLAVPLNTLDDKMLQRFYDAGWKFFRKFGTQGKPGFEIAIKHPNGLKMDIYGETSEGDFTWQAVWINKRAHMCAYENPTEWYTLMVDEFTSYPVHGNPEEFFKGVYGLNWRTPIPTKSYNWINPRCIKSSYTF